MSGNSMFAIPAGQQASLWLSYAVVLLLLPVCAVIAGVVVGVSNRDQSPEDGSLVRQFLLFLAIFAAATWGISRLPSVQSRINPEVKVREQLSANPAYEAIRKYAPSDAAKVQAALGSEVGRGVKLEDAFVRIRPLFATLVRERLGFVDQATAVAWAHVMRDTLQQMKAADPQKCVRTLYPEPGVPHPLSERVLSDASAAAFLQAVADVYASADAGMRRDTVRADPRVDLQALQTEYRLVQEQTKGEFGDDAGRTKDRQWREANPAAYCDIVLRKMQLMLQREPALAGSLLRQYLRGDFHGDIG
jgi:hypothetical protein